MKPTLHDYCVVKPDINTMVGLLKTSSSEDSIVEYKYFSKSNSFVWTWFQLEWIDPLGIAWSESILERLQKLLDLLKFHLKYVRGRSFPLNFGNCLPFWFEIMILQWNCNAQVENIYSKSVDVVLICFLYSNLTVNAMGWGYWSRYVIALFYFSWSQVFHR